MQKNLWLPVTLVFLSACAPVQTSAFIESKYDEIFVLEGGKQMSENKYYVIKDKITYIFDLNSQNLNTTIQNHTGSDISILWEKSNVILSGGEKTRAQGSPIVKPGETPKPAESMTQISAGTSAYLSIHPRPLVEPKPGEGLTQILPFSSDFNTQSVIINLHIQKDNEILNHSFTIQHTTICKNTKKAPFYGMYGLQC